jgi:hypothetical protein
MTVRGLAGIGCNTALSSFWASLMLGRIWGSHGGGYEEYYLLGYNAVYTVESQPTFRRNISPLSSGLCLPPAFTLVSWSAYSSTLNLEAICSSETSVNFRRTTRRYIAEDSTLRFWWCLRDQALHCVQHCWSMLSVPGRKHMATSEAYIIQWFLGYRLSTAGGNIAQNEIGK